MRFSWVSELWSEARHGFLANPMPYILFVFLLAALYQTYAQSEKLWNVCGMAQEAIDISMPDIPDGDRVLRTAEMPEKSVGYTLRELYRWQQLDGPQIQKTCD